ncbi:hypothetical protein ACKRZS_013488 [Fusarium odoratissimum]|uniref:Uncharacterized protein n=3 Tax=Fusarium oxysporum species complex TaxID=171631 RepID=N1RUV9_FUSC4|nr:hypothetical protein FOC4_g10008159 [Fusarium odoratissimum]KAH7214837.1 hypothetical protein DER44DRAFT_142192 [Fusarium oxysporum]KAK2125974.1 hypothetical protein NOF04DRAFT_1386443 [Fusarium oxysporum II5]TXC00225.1 hypothetical protein FocTR4_00014180 [Fusarium oxysporum f. sp. cubense]
MDKATLLTASKVDLNVSTHPRSDITRLIVPSLQIALRFQSLVGSISIFLCLHACIIASSAFVAVLQGSKIVSLNAFIAAKYSAFHSFNMSTQAVASAWNSKNVQRLRKKLWYEFAVFILGSGNLVFLMLFWPGWWVLAGACWAGWMLLG